MATFGFYGPEDMVPLRSFAAGLRSAGHRIAWRDHNAWSGETEKFDAVVIFGLRAQGRDLCAHYHGLGMPIVVIDHGYMRRVHRLEDYDEGYFQVGLARLGWVPPAAPDGDRFAALDVHPQSREPRPLQRLLLLGQVPFDASHHLTEEQLSRFYRQWAAEFEAVGLQVTFRGHPLARGVETGLRTSGIGTLEDALAQADVVASINSNSGLDALLAGLPAVTMQDCHYTSMAYRWPVPVAVIRPPEPARLRNFLERLSYAQWTAAEMRSGLPQAFLRNLGAIP